MDFLRALNIEIDGRDATSLVFFALSATLVVSSIFVYRYNKNLKVAWMTLPILGLLIFILAILKALQSLEAIQ